MADTPGDELGDELDLIEIIQEIEGESISSGAPAQRGEGVSTQARFCGTSA
jgi:hypothetical protein